MEESPRILDYQQPGKAIPSPSVAAVVIAFIVATGIASFLIFGHLDWVRFARPGARLYGPQDQYTYLASTINAVLWSGGMCLIGGGVFAATLLMYRRNVDWEDHGWIFGTALGCAYVAMFAATVWVSEQIAGPATGGPTWGEEIAWAAVGLIYPALAGWGMTRAIKRFR